MLERKDDFIKRLKAAFPYVIDPNYDDFDKYEDYHQACVGTGESNFVTVRLRYEIDTTLTVMKYPLLKSVHISVIDPIERVSKIFDVTNDMKPFVAFVIEIFKKQNEEEMKKKKDAMVADLSCMKLCGWMRTNELSVEHRNEGHKTTLDVYGTAFDKITLTVSKEHPDVFTCSMPRASFNEEQVKRFLTTCKELKQ